MRSPFHAWIAATLWVALGASWAGATPPANAGCASDAINILRRVLAETRDAHAPFYRIVIDDKPATAKGMADLEELYGTPHLLFQSDLAKLKEPMLVDGYVWYDSVEQFDLVKGSRGANFTPGQIEWARKWAADKGADIGQIFRKYAPDAIAKSDELTVLAKGIDVTKLSNEEALAALQKKLHEEFPNGFVVKLKEGWSSDGAFPGEQHDFVKVYSDYVKNVKPRMRALAAKGVNATDAHLALKGTPNYYEGMELEQFLEGHANALYVEERVKIARGTTYRNHENKLVAREKEFRVIVDSDGKVVHSMHRWDERRLLGDQEAEEAARFVQSVNDRFPPELRFQSGWDVVKLTDGRWKVMERNITEVGDLYPDINALTAQVIAERRLGDTHVQKAFAEFKAAHGLDAKAERLELFLKHKGIRTLVKERSALTEYLVAAKDGILEELRAAPTPANTRKALGIVRKYKLGDQLSRSEVEYVANLALAAGVAPAQIRRALQGGYEFIYADAAGKLQLALLNYDDRFIEELVAEKIRLRGGARAKTLKASELREAVRAEVDRLVIFRQSEPATFTKLNPALALDRKDLTDVQRLLYRGSFDQLDANIRKLLTTGK